MDTPTPTILGLILMAGAALVTVIKILDQRLQKSRKALDQQKDLEISELKKRVESLEDRHEKDEARYNDLLSRFDASEEE